MNKLSWYKLDTKDGELVGVKHYVHAKRWKYAGLDVSTPGYPFALALDELDVFRVFRLWLSP